MACLVAGIMASGAMVPSAHGQSSDALIDTLIKKGILSDQEAEDIKADLYKENKDLNKIKVNSGLKQFEIFGDARLRYEYREAQDASDDSLIRSRWRYRLRFGFKGTYKDNFYYGMRLETSEKGRSSNLTLGDHSGADFGKDGFEMRIGQLYLGWKPTDWFNMEGGKVALPFNTTSMVWDGDINPEGASERFNYQLMNDHLDVFANFGQYIYDTVDSSSGRNGLGLSAGEDLWFFGWQVGARYNFNENVNVQISPTIYNYVGDGTGPLTQTFAPYQVPAGAPVTSFNAINDLLILEIPMEVNFQLANLPWKVYADFAINLDASDRRDAAVAAGGVPAGTDDENIAYQIGLKVGSAKKKGTWEAEVFWQHSELFALDANLVDSDVFDSKLNMEGVAVKLGYAITDSIKANVTYAYGDAIEDDLGTGTGGDISKINPLFDYQLVQADLSWKF